MKYLQLPLDMTPEENMFIDLVRARMLQKLDDRRKFIFIYQMEQGHTKRETALVLGVNPTSITRHIKRIRAILSPYKRGGQVKDLVSKT